MHEAESVFSGSSPTHGGPMSNINAQQQSTHLEILRTPANLLTEEQKRSMIIEDRYSFF